MVKSILGGSFINQSAIDSTEDMELEINLEIWFRLVEKQELEYMLTLLLIIWQVEEMINGKITEIQQVVLVHIGVLKTQLETVHFSHTHSCI